jgi:hypothetical protein
MILNYYDSQKVIAPFAGLHPVVIQRAEAVRLQTLETRCRRELLKKAECADDSVYEEILEKAREMGERIFNMIIFNMWNKFKLI